MTPNLNSIKRLVHVYSGSTIQSLNKNTPTVKRGERYFNSECTGLESCTFTGTWEESSTGGGSRQTFILRLAATTNA